MAQDKPVNETGIYKVITTFTDRHGKRWQTDQDFDGDDVDIEMALEKGQIRADGEPVEVVGAADTGQAAQNAQNRQTQKPAQQNQQPRSTPDKSRA